MIRYTAIPRNKFATRNNQVYGGLLNHDSLSLKDIQSKRYKPSAFCQSDICMQNAKKIYNVRGLSGYAVKAYFVEEDICTKCGFYVFYSYDYDGPFSKYSKRSSARSFPVEVEED